MATTAELAQIKLDATLREQAAEKARTAPAGLTEDDLGYLPASTISEAMRRGDLGHLGLGKSRGSIK